ncbi:MAG TPA: hypothetical protein VMN39_08360 [Longimicrobiaceae bacterium]|nr:hypothetical protein [Longimicrobiaceae bacterium]
MSLNPLDPGTHGMLYGFFGRVTQSENLRESLNASMHRSRLIADRVSKATLMAGDGFAMPEAGAEPGTLQEGPVDLEAEMVSLADEQLFYEATTRLLQKAYEQIRSSLRDR